MVDVTVDFRGVHAFVVGGTSGINLGIAEGFATAGARVSVMSRSPEKVDAAVSRLRTLGAKAAGSAADVRDPDTTATALRRAHEEFGDIDVLWANWPTATEAPAPPGAILLARRRR